MSELKAEDLHVVDEAWMMKEQERVLQNAWIQEENTAKLRAQRFLLEVLQSLISSLVGRCSHRRIASG